MTNDDEKTVEEFKTAVNMTSGNLEKWLDSEESKKVALRKRAKANQLGLSPARKYLNC